MFCFFLKVNGSSLKYIGPLCSILTLVFPQIYKWKTQTLSMNLELSITCLNLLHSVLNQSKSSNGMASSKLLSVDQVCETILLNTDCSNSLLYLISNAFEFSQNIDNLQ